MYINTHISSNLTVNFFSVESNVILEQDCYEFILIQQGAVIIHSKNEDYSINRGDIILIHPNEKITISKLSDNYLITLRFDRTLINQILTDETMLICNSSNSRKADYAPLIKVIEEICAYYDNEQTQLFLLAKIYELLYLLQSKYIISKYDDNKCSIKKAKDVRNEQIKIYINANYYMPLTMQELANHFYLSPQYLSRIFHESFGVSFNHYITELRLSHAIDELLGTDHSITSIAFNNGFSGVSTFNRLFRSRFGTSPSRYRNNKSLSGEISKIDYDKMKTTFISSDEKQENEVLNLSFLSGNKFSAYASWTDTINIGPLENALSHEFYDSFYQMQQNLHFRYVRFSNLLTENFIVHINSKVGYSFYDIDIIFDYFKKIHIIPFIELENKPKNVIKAYQKEYSPDFEKADTTPLSTRLDFLNAFLSHLIGRYGSAYVSSFRFELWSTHDDFFEPLESADEYVEKYIKYNDIIKKLLPDASFGGPGYNTARSSEYFISILSAMKKRAVNPDFISISIFCYEKIPAIYEVSGNKHSAYGNSPNPEYASDMFEKYHAEIKKVFDRDIPLFITEFNSGIYTNNRVASSAFQAAFICHNMLALFNKTNCIAWWHFSDPISSTFINMKNPMSSSGLIDTHQLPKPSYFAFSLLSVLKSTIYEYSTSHMLASNEKNIYQILLVNYIHYNKNYCFSDQHTFSIDKTYEVFESATKKDLTISVSGLPIGRYRLIRQRLNREHGSLLDIFINILNKGETCQQDIDNMFYNMHKSDIEYLRGVAVPLKEIIYFDTDNGETSMQLTLEPHEVTLLNIEKQL